MKIPVHYREALVKIMAHLGEDFLSGMLAVSLELDEIIARIRLGDEWSQAADRVFRG